MGSMEVDPRVLDDRKPETKADDSRNLFRDLPLWKQIRLERLVPHHYQELENLCKLLPQSPQAYVIWRAISKHKKEREGI